MSDEASTSVIEVIGESKNYFKVRSVPLTDETPLTPINQQVYLHKTKMPEDTEIGDMFEVTVKRWRRS